MSKGYKFVLLFDTHTGFVHDIVPRSRLQKLPVTNRLNNAQTAVYFAVINVPRDRQQFVFIYILFTSADLFSILAEEGLNAVGIVCQKIEVSPNIFNCRDIPVNDLRWRIVKPSVCVLTLMDNNTVIMCTFVHNPEDCVVK